eukprot:CAMPEP_0206135806 /NCGR_PEP_ID=MMETSP1473-20131121/1072_1 /ASSEMBLY_ACC=CAM_ASM_001109 /TAXON_ID=1461547 /ORGANISM="Stichococcus sp, Strain RCC1054" /LENGTH=582 /DNA_ID=CAMNT_0053527905 /DNA_START=243 /DNA_END=1992 /DNA_ORIENTATION=-
MSYYHEARALVKGMKERVEVNKRNRERRAEQAGIEQQGEDPVHLLRVDGRSCRLFRNDEARAAVERMEGMLPWNGKADNMIDRFDGRALLDFYREPDGRQRPKTEDALEEEELVAFEAYRDLVNLAGQESEEAGLALAESDNLQIRADSKSTSIKNRPAKFAQKDVATAPAGFGQFGAVGFSYGGEAAHDPVAAAGGAAPPWAPQPTSDASESDSESDSSETDEEEAAAKQLGEADYEEVAASFGILGYQSMLRRTLRDEKREAEGRKPKPKRALSRKKAAQRARRMKGQGHLLEKSLSSLGAKPIRITPTSAQTASFAYRTSRRGSPSYEGDPSERRHRRRSRSRSPVAKPRVQYITSFGTSGGSAAGGLNRGAGEQLAFRMPGSDSQQGEPHRGGASGSGGTTTPSTAGGTTASPQVPAVVDEAAKQREKERAERYEARQKERAKEKAAEQRRQFSLDKPTPPKQAGKETTQQRMKRLMAAQINKQVAHDGAKERARQAQEERDAAARRQIERAAMASPAPAPGRLPGIDRGAAAAAEVTVLADTPVAIGPGLLTATSMPPPLSHLSPAALIAAADSAPG